MRKLIMWNIITLDGCFEGVKSWDLPWHERVWGPELEQFSIEQLRSADFLVFGRVTYQGMASYWRTRRPPVHRPLLGGVTYQGMASYWRTVEGEVASYMNS